MNFAELYHLLFETYTGIGILVGAGIVISILLCVVFEIRTKKRYRDQGPANEEDDWSIFGDDEDDEDDDDNVDDE